ncbi:MAG: type II toxin-antitoxin system RelE/ParE family toxin [Syntrophobacteraceae bacterium]
MPTWKVNLTSEARGDFKKLDGREKVLVAKQLAKLEESPQIGKHLGSKIGMDLTGYYKLYADGNRIRIIYTIEANQIVVIAIGPRQDMEVYQLASKRIPPKPS